MKPDTLIIAVLTLSASIALLSGCHSDGDETLANKPAPHHSVKLSRTATISAETVQGIVLSDDRQAIRQVSSKRQASDMATALLPPMPVSTQERSMMTADLYGGENYAEMTRNATIQTVSQPVSTFSIDVDTGSYANVRRFLQAGRLPPANSVREEELLNYFSYDYNNASDTEQPFSLTTELGRTPWNARTRLLHIGLKGYVPPTSEIAAANLVFLIDVSGSMNSPDKLGLLKSSISLMTQQLDENDTVSLVVYAGSSGIVLEPTAGDQHRKIDQALSRLSAGGSTNGAQGIELAYQLASEHFKEDGVTRVILATDGDFNVGISDVDQLKQLIARKRESGIALTTLGFGTGNYNDHLMEQLADTGNGAYAYIDTLSEARKVLVDQLQATLLTIASDVKIQIEFNPAVVSEYRLIGYSNRQLANEDFNNDRVDAGEIGAGHTVTALYEIALHGEGGERHSPSRYGRQDDKVSNEADDASLSSEVAELRLRYKLPGENDSRLSTRIVSLGDSGLQNLQANSDNFRFSASVAAFGQLLRGDDRLADYDYQDARRLAANAMGDDPFGYRAEYLRLLDLAGSLDRLSRMDQYSPHREEG
ncbi:vWA domain-containing protein [Granulosicoccus sp. 3-233]|uniref:vWA domain-containing protein n=1 Tax=Granulosicoccus sp. 3-233 TaxID=3417969 RepID=UPI003D32A0EB